MRAVVLILVALLGVASALSSLEGDYAADHIIVKHKSGQAITQSVQATHGVQLQRKLHSTMNLHLYTVTDGSSVEDKVALLNKQSDVEYAEPDYFVYHAATPNDVDYSVQWHHGAINSPGAWDIITDAKLPNVKVCQIDGGVRADHPDFQGSILDGWSFVPSSGDISDYPVDRNSPDFKNITDSSGHGTFAAGLITATGNNTIDTVGVAWSANLLVCKFFWPNRGLMSDAAQCLDLCREAGASVVSAPWTNSNRCQFMADMVNSSYESGMLLVAPSGNKQLDADTNEQYPAHFFMDSSLHLDNLITVASIDWNNNLSPFSNYGQKTVTMAAPGSGMHSLDRFIDVTGSEGTSFSTSLVAGVLTLMKAYAASHGVDATAAQLKAALIEGGTAVAGLENSLQTGKVLNAEGALLALIKNLNLGASPPPPNSPPPASPANPPPSPVSSPPPSPVSSPPPSPANPTSPPSPATPSSPSSGCQEGDAACICLALGRYGSWAETNTDCSTYYSCQKGEAADYVTCPAGQVFDTPARSCVAASTKPKCSGITTPYVHNVPSPTPSPTPSPAPSPMPSPTPSPTPSGKCAAGAASCVCEKIARFGSWAETTSSCLSYYVCNKGATPEYATCPEGESFNTPARSCVATSSLPKCSGITAPY